MWMGLNLKLGGRGAGEYTTLEGIFLLDAAKLTNSNTVYRARQ